MASPRPHRREEFSVALICALPIEFDAAALAFDETWPARKFGKAPSDYNSYTFGRMGDQNVVLVLLHKMGKTSAASATTSLRHSFSSVKLAVLCGICGGVPNPDFDVEILLGDVIISENVVQYDYGRQYPSKFAHKNTSNELLGAPGKEIRSFLARLKTDFGRDEFRHQVRSMMGQIQQKAVRNGHSSKYLRPSIDKDVLFQRDYPHRHRNKPDCGCDKDIVCDDAIIASCADLQCDPQYHVRRNRLNGQNGQERGIETVSDTYISPPEVFVGTVGSGDTVMKSGEHRDMMAQQHGIIAFEMEGAGVWDEIPCIIVKSVCDYADSHKNKKWQGFAAVAAASATKAALNMSNFGAAPTATTNVSHTEEAPNSAFIVPYTENLGFVGRLEILEHIKDLFGHSEHFWPGSKPRSRVALHGLGGVGKTQIALAYCYWFRETFRDASVFWIHASNVQRFQEAFSDIARKCEVPGHNKKEVDIFELVKRWLEDKQRGRWLLVIDNADTEVFPTNPTAEAGRRTTSIANSIPECSHGSVLITTRNKQAGLKLTRGKLPIEVERMTEIETTQLLRTLLEDENVTPAEASLLSSRLEHLPLALAQATSFILENSMSTKAYVGLLDKSEYSIVDRLSDPFEANGRDNETPHALTATWAISFEHIEQQNPMASEVLYLMSFFDRHAIPKQFVWDYRHEKLCEASCKNKNSGVEQGDDSDSIDIDLEVTQALGFLQAFSFISKSGDESFDMHRLVQLVTRKQLADRGAMPDFATSALKIVRKAFPQSTFENRVLCLQLLPHALTVLEHVEAAREEPLEEEAELSREVGWYFHDRDQYEASEKHLLRAFRSYCEVLGPEADDALTVMCDLTNLYIDMDRADKALEIASGVLEIDEKLHPEDKDLILRDKALVGSALTKLGRFEEAEPLCLQILTQRKAMEGEEHSNTLNAYESVAHIYYQTGRLREAQKLCIELVELTEKILGKDDPTTLKRMSSLSRTHRELGYYEDAEKLALRITDTRARLLGDSHPRTISSLERLLKLYREMGRSEEEAKVRLRLWEAKRAVQSD